MSFTHSKAQKLQHFVLFQKEKMKIMNTSWNLIQQRIKVMF